MSRPSKHPLRIVTFVSEEVLERMLAARQHDETQPEFIRAAIEHELKARER